MVRRYLIERKKERSSDFYIMRILEVDGVAADALNAVRGEFMPGEEARVSMLCSPIVVVADDSAQYGFMMKE